VTPLEEELRAMLRDGARGLGVELPGGSLELFMRYLKELKAWGRKINLTAIESDREIVIRHFLDSLTPYRSLAGVEGLLDIGTGAGFPGLPLKIACPGLKAVLMDSVSKKVFFVRHVIRTLGLDNVEAVCARAEDQGTVERLGKGFDCVITRALSGLDEIVGLALPYLKDNGTIIAMKGPSYLKELRGFRREGVSLLAVNEVRLPFSDRTTVVIVLKKSGA
jgi:16S rRNA (guanine527-N7)-methyltransferase